MRPCRYILVLSTIALGLWACGDSTDPDDDPLPDNAATAVGLTVRDNVEASLDAFFPQRLLQPLSIGPAADPCATASAPGDTDGDGVPDEANYTFTAPPCRFEGIRGFNLDVVGQLRIVDPVPETAGFGAVVDLTNFRFSLTAEDTDRNYSVTRNGRLTLSGTTAGLELASELQILRTFTGLSDAAMDIVWTMDFDPETTLQINQPLPSGSVTVSGHGELVPPGRELRAHRHHGDAAPLRLRLRPSRPALRRRRARRLRHLRRDPGRGTHPVEQLRRGPRHRVRRRGVARAVRRPEGPSSPET